MNVKPKVQQTETITAAPPATVNSNVTVNKLNC